MPIHTDQRFPYYSDALGCVITSRQHLAAVEKAQGVTRVTQWDLDKSVRHIRAENERLAAAEEADRDRRENDPALKQFREMRDRGALTDHLTGRRREMADRALGRKP